MKASALNESIKLIKPKWMDVISADIDEHENYLETLIQTDVTIAYEMSHRLFCAGGKRVRPALLMISAYACKGIIDHAKMMDVAGASELVHTASLVHDDVVDEANERRGLPTSNQKFGNKLSVLGGDFLLSRAFSVLAKNDDKEILQMVSKVAGEMSEAEMLQVVCENSLELWETNYWKIIKGKTAAFISACCECGAILADAPLETRIALRTYGENVGIAFQITDDLLDIIGDSSKTGKQIGTDIINGKYTLPVIFALEDDKDNHLRKILKEYGRDTITPENASMIAHEISKRGAVEKARNTAIEYSRKAVIALECISDSEYKKSLLSFADSVVCRLA